MSLPNDTAASVGDQNSHVSTSAFQDLSVQNAVSGTNLQMPTGNLSLDDFSPFSATQRTISRVAAGGASQQSPAKLPATDAPPAYAPSSAQRISTDELEKRARELAEKEAQLTAREEALARATHLGGPLKNWPPLPSWFPLGPCFYQDIQVEIPPRFQVLARRGYYLWIFHTFVLLLNFVGAICYFAAVSGKPDLSSSAGTTLGCALLFIVMFTPCSYVCWFRPLYKALRSDSSLHFFSFFIIFFAQLIVSVVNAIGFVGYGAVGWINSLATIGTNLGVGIYMLVCASCFTALALLDAILLVTMHRMYRSTGASFAQAKTELAASVFANPAAQTAMAHAAAASVGASSAGAHRF